MFPGLACNVSLLLLLCCRESSPNNPLSENKPTTLSGVSEEESQGVIKCLLEEASKSGSPPWSIQKSFELIRSLVQFSPKAPDKFLVHDFLVGDKKSVTKILGFLGLYYPVEVREEAFKLAGVLVRGEEDKIRRESVGVERGCSVGGGVGVGYGEGGLKGGHEGGLGVGLGVGVSGRSRVRPVNRVLEVLLEMKYAVPSQTTPSEWQDWWSGLMARMDEEMRTET